MHGSKRKADEPWLEGNLATKALLAAKGTRSLVTGRTGLALGALAVLPLGVWAAQRVIG